MVILGKVGPRILFRPPLPQTWGMLFLSIVVTGCHCHLGQSLLSEVNELGLNTIYNSEPDFALHARMLHGIAYLPTADVPAALEPIRTTMPVDRSK